MLIETVTADGKITDEEAGQLKTWLDDNQKTDLPGIEFLRATVNHILADGQVTPDERRELHKAVERILPPEARRGAKDRRTALENLEKAQARAEKEATRAQERDARELRRPVGAVNFMVAGVTHEGRAAVIKTHAKDNETVFLARNPSNVYDANAIEVRLGVGLQIGFVPRDEAARLAPLLDAGATHEAYITKILNGRRAPIPVVQAYLYRPEANIAGAVSQAEIPPRRAPAPGRATCSACAAAVAAVLAVIFLAILRLIL